jgi:putative CocE/NonD family hydrolase
MLFFLLAIVLQSASAPTTPDSVAIRFDVRIPMRDGVTLSADIYRPAAPGRYPVVLMRTPYNKNGTGVLKEARAFAERGYVYVAVDVRGRGTRTVSGVPIFTRDDGYDAIEWSASELVIREGRNNRAFYVGYNQWVAAVRKPPHLAAIIALAPMADPFEDVWITGPGGAPAPT